MSIRLSPGNSHIFTTRVVGQTTLLTVFFLDPFGDGFVDWHKELCCEGWHHVFVPGGKVIDISAAGALVTVASSPTNTEDMFVRTDYI